MDRRRPIPFRWTPELALKLIVLIFLAGGAYYKLDGMERRLQRIEQFLDAHMVMAMPTPAVYRYQVRIGRPFLTLKEGSNFYDEGRTRQSGSDH